jgi:hypothetical protein
MGMFVVKRLGIVLRRSEQPVLGPREAGRFNPVNRRRDSFHRVAVATLEHAVLESSDVANPCVLDRSGSEDVRLATVAAIFRAWMHSESATSILNISKMTFDRKGAGRRCGYAHDHQPVSTACRL